MAVLPVLFGLLWRHGLHADLTRPLSEETLVATAGHGEAAVGAAAE